MCPLKLQLSKATTFVAFFLVINSPKRVKSFGFIIVQKCYIIVGKSTGKTSNPKIKIFILSTIMRNDSNICFINYCIK